MPNHIWSILATALLLGLSCYLLYREVYRRAGWRGLRRADVWPWLAVAGSGLVIGLWNARRIDLINAGRLPADLIAQARTWLTIGMTSFVLGFGLSLVALYRARHINR